MIEMEVFMEKGINLNLSKSLIDFDELLGLSVQGVSAKEFSLQIDQPVIV